jgi:hypothetical protein
MNLVDNVGKLPRNGLIYPSSAPVDAMLKAIQSLANRTNAFRQAWIMSFPLPRVDKPPRGTHRWALVLVTVSNLSIIPVMTKRKRTWTDDAPETLPESSSRGPDLDNLKDQTVLDVLPGITRKITACGACRKQKVRNEFVLSD